MERNQHRSTPRRRTGAEMSHHDMIWKIRVEEDAGLPLAVAAGDEGK